MRQGDECLFFSLWRMPCLTDDSSSRLPTLCAVELATTTAATGAAQLMMMVLTLFVLGGRSMLMLLIADGLSWMLMMLIDARLQMLMLLSW